MSVEDIKSLAQMILLVLATGVGGMAILGFIVVGFFIMDEE
jgi:hypothetical protein